MERHQHIQLFDLEANHSAHSQSPDCDFSGHILLRVSRLASVNSQCRGIMGLKKR